jgi:hypothetical protein
MRLFVGDDWAEDHHDVEVMDETGTVLEAEAGAPSVAVKRNRAAGGRRQHRGLLGHRRDPSSVLPGRWDAVAASALGAMAADRAWGNKRWKDEHGHRPEH